jgi:dethiobiotin synthetase
MVQTIFITGIGTGIGKTVVSAIIAEALQADLLESRYKQAMIKELIRNGCKQFYQIQNQKFIRKFTN